MARIGTKKKRKPRPPQDPHRKKKARKSRGDTLTLKKLEELIAGPPIIGPGAAKGGPQSDIVDQNRDAIGNGDLLALLEVLETYFCHPPRGPGWVDAGRPEKKHQRTIETPAWLLGELMYVLLQGLGGHWPKVPHGRGSPLRRRLDANRDLWWAWQSLKARESGLIWEDVFSQVAERASRSGRSFKPDAVAKAYQRVKKNLRKDPDYYRVLGVLSPRLLDAAVGPPYRS